MRGRKPRYESRSAEFRQRLAEWKQVPESSRPSLRALARELETSHQLLRHYLAGLETWRACEDWRRAREIRANARAEGRFLTPWENQQATALDRGALSRYAEAMLENVFRKWTSELERDVQQGKPPSVQTKRLLGVFASRGDQRARAIIERFWRSQPGRKSRRNNLPAIPSGAAKSFRTVLG